MYKDMYVEYYITYLNVKHTDVMSWRAFCNLCLERGIEIIFCCATDDPRVNKE